MNRFHDDYRNWRTLIGYFLVFNDSFYEQMLKSFLAEIPMNLHKSENEFSIVIEQKELLNRFFAKYFKANVEIVY